MSQYADFKDSYALQASKIEDDPQLMDADKELFRAHIEAWNASSDITQHVADFCHENQLRGPRLNVNHTETLGHGHDKREFLLLLTTGGAMTKDAAEELLRYWTLLDDDEQVVEVHNQIGQQFMGQYLMWSFRDSTALADVPNANLACRLGLDEAPDKTYLFWGLRLPTATGAHLPTAFDAWEHLDRWAPGGHTVPNEQCRDRYPDGFPEVVHRPVRFDSLSVSIR